MKNIKDKDFLASLIFAILFFGCAVFCAYLKDIASLVVSSTLSVSFLIVSLEQSKKK